jgi:hypothetical protein
MDRFLCYRLRCLISLCTTGDVVQKKIQAVVSEVRLICMQQ